MEEDLLQGPEDGQPGRDVIIIFAVFFELSLAPFSLLLGWIMGRNPLEKFQWSLNDALWGVGAALPLIALFISVLTWPIGPLARSRSSARMRSCRSSSRATGPNSP